MITADQERNYVVVEFPEEVDEEGKMAMEVVTSAWLFERNGDQYCYWPDLHKTNKEHPSFEAAVSKHLEVDTSDNSKIEWSENLVNIKYKNASLSRTKRKLKRLELNDEVSQTENEDLEDKRRSRKSTHLQDYVDPDDDDLDTNLPKPPVLKTNFASNKKQFQPRTITTNTTKHQQQSGEQQSREHQSKVNETLLLQILRKIEDMSDDMKHLIRVSNRQENGSGNGTEVSNISLRICNTQEELQAFDASLLSKEFAQNVIITFQTIGGSDAADLTRRMLGKIISTKLAISYNWKGVNGKGRFSDHKNILNVLLVAVRRNKFGEEATEKEVVNVVKCWLRNAPDREGGRAKRMLKKSVNV